MEYLAGSTETAAAIAERLGRTRAAVARMRQQIRRDPRVAHLAGVDTDVARLADPAVINIAPRYGE